MPIDTADDAETAFYAAFESLDLPALRALLDPTAVCVHPGGTLLQGTEAVLQSWAEIFASADPPRIEFQVVQRTWSGDLAVHLVEEHIYANGKTSAKPAPVLATNTYLRRDGSWKLLAHHASLPLMRRTAGHGTTKLH
ncbi:MAG: nuclear transport factor 2 family protein [Gammaproteobacteria bacterium]|nr:nuclear transport factor 2 family protein [Gammaproteobacteria bacterium]